MLKNVNNQRQAPEEPDVHAPSDSSETVVVPPEVDVVAEDPGYDIPASEVDIAKSNTEGEEYSETTTAGPKRGHALLAKFDSLRSEGRSGEAMLGFHRLLDAIDKLDEPSVEEQAVWVGALRRGIETAVADNQVDGAVEQIGQAARWFNEPHWQRWREHTTDRFSQLITLARHMGHDRDALELYDKARGMTTLSAEARLALAQSAARLSRTDLAAADLYLDFLESGRGNAEECRTVLALLRAAIRVDLASPDNDALKDYQTLNDRLWVTRAVTWCAAHRAIAAVRSGDLGGAWALREAAVDVEEADAETLVLLGTVSYLCHRWTDALDLLAQAAKQAADSPGLERYYLPMARISSLLAGTTSPESREKLIQQLQDDVAAVQDSQLVDVTALDCPWVVGTGLFLLNRDEEAMASFQQAPLRFLAWRYAHPELETMSRLDRRDQISDRLTEIKAGVSGADDLVRLLAAWDALGRLALHEVQGLVESVDPETPGSDVADGDIPAVHECLRTELAFCQAQALVAAPEMATATEDVSAGVRAWRARLKCRWHLERGEMEQAAQVLNDPIHWLAPEGEVRRLEAVRLALLGMNEDVAKNIFEHLASVPGARPGDRLAWGLWLCGHNDHRRAREVLASLADVLPDCLELRLARAETELADGNDGQAGELLEPLENLAQWINPPRVVPYRPWQRRLPITVWDQDAKVSMHRIADMLHGANLMIQAGRIDRALRVLEMIEQQLGEVRAVINPQLGGVLRQACLAEMAAHNLESACKLHTKASKYVKGDADFAVQVADATADQEATPPDGVLEVLHEWVCRFEGEDETFDRSPVASALRRFLFIDQTMGEGADEIERRRHWTESLAEARPQWDWPKRNLARDAARNGRHEEVLAFIESVRSPDANDYSLQGRSAWELCRYEVARDSFAKAVEAGQDVPEVRAWHGCARAATRFQEWAADHNVPTDDELAGLLPGLAWDGCGDDLEALVRTWHAAVLVAARHGVRAAEVLHPERLGKLPEELRPIVNILRGFGRLLAEQIDEALHAWDPGEELLAANPLQLALRLIVLGHRPGYRHRHEVGEQLIHLRKRGVDHELFHLAAANHALRQGDRQAAREEFVHANEQSDTEPLPLLLTPLRPHLDAEHAFLRARLLMHDGQHAEAAEAFTSLGQHVLGGEAADYWLAIASVGPDRRQTGEELLAKLAGADPPHIDAMAQLSLLEVRSGRLDEAQKHARRSAQLEAGHPFALLAMAEIQECRGDNDAAAANYELLISQHAESAGPRTLAVAETALGRLRQQAGQLDEAQQHLRKALELRPAWIVARKRLAFILVTAANTAHQSEEAEALLTNLTEQLPDDVILGLARAAVVHRLARWEDVADQLDRVIHLPGFQELPDETRRETALWSIDIQLLQRRFGAAAGALEELARRSDSPEIEERLIQCWLLEAMHRLQAVPLCENALQEALAGAQAVRARQDDHPLAVLLAALCLVLLDKSDEDETRQLAGRLARMELGDSQQRALAVMVRHLAGDDEALSEAGAVFDGNGEESAIKRCLDVLSANQHKDLSKLVEEARALAAGSDEAKDAILLGHDELVLVGALQNIASKREEEAAKLLDTWHRRGCGSAQTRMLNSQLLARQAVNMLKARKLQESRDLLAAAVNVLATNQLKL